MAEALATQAAIAIQNAMLFESELAAHKQAERKSEQMSALNRLAQLANSAVDLHSVLEVMAREIMILLNARSTGVGLLNPERSELTVVAYASQSDEQPAIGLKIPLAGNIATQQVIETRRSVVIEDAQNSPLQDESARSVFRDRNTQCCLSRRCLRTARSLVQSVQTPTSRIGSSLRKKWRWLKLLPARSRERLRKLVSSMKPVKRAPRRMRQTRPKALSWP